MGEEEITVNYKLLQDVIKKLLRNRNVYDQESLERYLLNDFNNLIEGNEVLNNVALKIMDAISKCKKIMIWGDEDMDGITSTLLLLYGFRSLINDKFETYIPSRGKEGYGLSEEGIDKADAMGIDLIITVDCGISSYKEVEYLKDKGMEVIITDHHEPQEKLPDCLILNPKLDSFGYSYLSGAGVAFKLIDKLIKNIKNVKTDYWVKKIPELPVLSMIGTISDRVPELDENRIIIKEGFKSLEYTKNPALSFLRDIKGNFYNSIEPLHSGSENLTWEFFTSNSKDEAGLIYEKLEVKHSQWSFKAREIFTSFLEQIRSGHLVLFDPDLEKVYAGTVANRARDHTGYPVFVVYMVGDVIRGEGRGPSDFDMLSVLKSVKDILIDYGGHKPACGFTLKQGKIEEFRKRVEVELKEYEPQTYYDLELNLSQITPELQKFINRMKPFGGSNPPPVFLIKNINYEVLDDQPVLWDDKSELPLDEVRELPPPSRFVDAYLKMDGEKIYLIKWEWAMEENNQS